MAVARDLQGAIDLAARILDEMGVREPPVPDRFISSIDPARTVRVVLEPLRRGTRGATMLSPDDAEWWVVLNANDRYPVRRFTLAHAAFHIACGTGLAFRRDGMGWGSSTNARWRTTSRATCWSLTLGWNSPT